MPELPEVETVRRGLEKSVKGAIIKALEVRRRDLRFPIPKDFEQVVTGKTITAIDRRAKYLLIRLSGSVSILMHLGMSGKILVKPQAEKYGKHDHLVFHLSNNRVMIFNDARRFGMADIIKKGEEEKHKLLRGIGIEPLSASFNAAFFSKKLQRKNQPIKHALMDQRVVAGVGNIYAAEALFMAGIHPMRAAGKLSQKEITSLVAAIKKVLQAAIKSGGSTLRDYVRSDGDAGYFQHRFRVYGRDKEACFSCKNRIKKLTQGGRSTWFCPQCQTA